MKKKKNAFSKKKEENKPSKALKKTKKLTEKERAAIGWKNVLFQSTELS